MRLLIVLWLLISLAATGIFTYRHHHRGSEATIATRDMEAARPGARGGASHDFAAREPRRFHRASRRDNSGESLALMVSIVSSVVSAIAAVAQAWFTHRAMKDVRPGL